MVKRVFLIVLDSFGIGEMPDAASFGDEGSNTLRAVRASQCFSATNLMHLGLFNIDGVEGMKTKNVVGNYARLAEKSAGKDTTVGHWEIAGLVSTTPFPTYPDGFSREIIERFERETGKKTLCNKPYSGTKVILDYGREHIENGALIVYTSADSVFQIAAHEDIVPVEDLYEYCRIARSILSGKDGVARVIARPFSGEYPDFVRTGHRHDFSLAPPSPTMLDLLSAAGLETIGVGKIGDIFAGKGVSQSYTIADNDEGMAVTARLLKEDFKGLCFVNLVDFDMKYGHRNDIDGYAEAVSRFDDMLASFMMDMNKDDVLIITADHGCDPSTDSTDHSREYVFMLAYGKPLLRGVNLGTRDSFADISATILEMFGLENKLCGQSFFKEITNVCGFDF